VGKKIAKPRQEQDFSQTVIKLCREEERGGQCQLNQTGKKKISSACQWKMCSRTSVSATGQGDGSGAGHMRR